MECGRRDSEELESLRDAWIRRELILSSQVSAKKLAARLRPVALDFIENERLLHRMTKMEWRSKYGQDGRDCQAAPPLPHPFVPSSCLSSPGGGVWFLG